MQGVIVSLEEIKDGGVRIVEGPGKVVNGDAFVVEAALQRR